MKCVVCDLPADYIYWGATYCKEHMEKKKQLMSQKAQELDHEIKKIEKQHKADLKKLECEKGVFQNEALELDREWKEIKKTLKKPPRKLSDVYRKK